jgi:hypothetical protein
VRRPERDRGISTNLQAKLPGSQAAGWGRRVAVKGRMSNVADYRRQGTLVSDRAFQASWNLAVTASATAAVACTGAAAPS